MAKTLEEYALCFAGMSRRELSQFNDCLMTRDLKLDDFRQEAPPDPPLLGEDSFVRYRPMSEDKLQVLLDLTVDFLWWTKDDVKRLDTLLKRHDIRILKRRITETWEQV